MMASMANALLGVCLSQARVRRIVKTAAAGVYVSDVNVRPIVKPAARIRSRVGVPDRPCASGEQHRQTNNGQSTFEVVHWSLSVTLMFLIGREPIGQIRPRATPIDRSQRHFFGPRISRRGKLVRAL